MLADSIYKIIAFQKNYAIYHPNEIQPTSEILDYVFNNDNLTVHLSPMNLIVYRPVATGYEIVAHWCVAHKDLPRDKNMQAFFEVLRLVKSLGEVFISHLNNEYHKATIDCGNGIRRFK